MSKSNKRNVFSEALAGAMIGFAVAVGSLDSQKQAWNYPTASIVTQVEPNPITRSVIASESTLTLPKYSGNPYKIPDSALENTGSLLKKYSPEIFVPNPPTVNLTYINNDHNFRTEFFHTYDVGVSSVFRNQSEKIYFPGTQSEEVIYPLLVSANTQFAENIITACANEVKQSKYISTTDSNRVYESLTYNQSILIDYLLDELDQVRNDIWEIKSTLRSSQFAITETPERVASQLSLKKAFETTPQRYLERGVDYVADKAIKATAMTVAKLIAGAFLAG